MSSTYKLQVGQGGTITLPEPIQESNAFFEGEMVQLLELNEETLVISRKTSQVNKVADRMAQQWQDAGVLFESLMKALREIREG